MNLSRGAWIPLVIGLGLIAGCKTDPGEDTDTASEKDTVNPDPEPSDPDGTLADATPLGDPLGAAVPDVAVALTDGADNIAPAGDNDFFSLTLDAGVPVQLWVATGDEATADPACDTVLRVYPPGATQAAKTVQIGEDPSWIYDPGDVLAEEDDLPYRWQEGDPGLVLVPPESGTYTLEVLHYGEATAGTEGQVGFSGCRYQIWAKRRAPLESECNDWGAVSDALDAATGPQDTAPPDGVVTPASDGFVPNPFWVVPVDGVPSTPGEEFSGWLSSGSDTDLWAVQFGDFDSLDGHAWWTFSLWQDHPIGLTRRLTLYDRALGVLATTTDPVPDGNFGFFPDAGIAYAVRENETYYLQISHDLGGGGPDVGGPETFFLTGPTDAPPGGPGPRRSGGSTESGTFYLGEQHGFGQSLVQCGLDAESGTVNWWEGETRGGVRNDDYTTAQVLRLCQAANSDLYFVDIAGTIEPNVLPFRYELSDERDPELPPNTFPCEDTSITGCPDMDWFSLNNQSRAGGALGGRRVRVSVQAATVGSYLVPEVILFTPGQPPVHLKQSGSGDLATEEMQLGEGDAVVETFIPDGASSVYLLVQAKALHPERAEANSWFMRVFVDK